MNLQWALPMKILAFGPTLNAADNSRVPGGSSGASAVAVQAGLCMASLGTDTGGSDKTTCSFLWCSRN